VCISQTFDALTFGEQRPIIFSFGHMKYLTENQRQNHTMLVYTEKERMTRYKPLLYQKGADGPLHTK